MCDSQRDDVGLDAGQFSYYAGPVRVDGKDRCIWASGTVGEWTVVTRPDGRAAFCG